MATIATTRDSLLEKIREILADVTDNEQLQVIESTTAEDVPDWDSINHVRLLTGIEKELGFRFETKDLGGLQNVGQLIDLIEKRRRK